MAFIIDVNKVLTFIIVVTFFTFLNVFLIFLTRFTNNIQIKKRYINSMYSVSQKTSPTFLAVTLESIVGFL